jgi:hypothetical protein
MGNPSKTRATTMKGNKNNNKFVKYPEDAKAAFKSYCDWIAQGDSSQSWTFKGKETTFSYKTMENYMREYPSDFPISHKEIALAQSLKIWEDRGLAMMLGQIDKSQPAIFQMFMRNKFGWDKENYGQKESTEPLVKSIAQMWRKKHE